MQGGFDFSRDVNERPRAGGRTRTGLPWSGRTAISRHRSAQAAQQASATRVTKTMQYIALIEKYGRVGISDHQASKAMGWPLSSVNSIRNGCAGLVEANPDQFGVSPWKRPVTLWRKRT